MSTKCTVAYGDNFHLYEEIFDNGLYLRMEGPNIEFEAFRDRVTVRLPKEILRVILDNSEKIDNFLKQDRSWESEE